MSNPDESKERRRFRFRKWKDGGAEDSDAGLKVPSEVVETTAELVRRLQKYPEDVRSLPPRRFEEMVAALLVDMGYEAELTPETRDGGRDILVGFKTPIKTFMGLVECKRWSAGRGVGVDVIRNFLFVLREKDKANFGMVATTSFFTSDAEALQKEYEWLLTFKDYEGLREWIGKYGKWDKLGSGELWLPRGW